MRYIGNKTKLLTKIESLVEEKCSNSENFCDIFSGTGSVARYFKKDYLIQSNDLLFFSYCLQYATIKLNKKPKFEVLKKNLGISCPIDFFNTILVNEIKVDDNYFVFNNYSVVGNRMYFTEENAKLIDFIRISIEQWYIKDIVSYDEYIYLIACLIESVPYVANIAGTFGAYHKFWDKRTLQRMKFLECDVHNNNMQNECYNMDSNDLINQISGDILYLDPPYNGRQYLSNYHILETIALYDFPNIKGVTGQRAVNDKKSKYCLKKEACQSLEELIKTAKFEHIILSYSTEGIISVAEITDIFIKYTNETYFELIEIPYQRFKSHSLGEEKIVKELIFYGRKL